MIKVFAFPEDSPCIVDVSDDPGRLLVDDRAKEKFPNLRPSVIRMLIDAEEDLRLAGFTVEQVVAFNVSGYDFSDEEWKYSLYCDAFLISKVYEIDYEDVVSVFHAELETWPGAMPSRAPGAMPSRAQPG